MDIGTKGNDEISNLFGNPVMLCTLMSFGTKPSFLFISIPPPKGHDTAFRQDLYKNPQAETSTRGFLLKIYK